MFALWSTLLILCVWALAVAGIALVNNCVRCVLGPCKTPSISIKYAAVHEARGNERLCVCDHLDTLAHARFASQIVLRSHMRMCSRAQCVHIIHPTASVFFIAPHRPHSPHFSKCVLFALNDLCMRVSTNSLAVCVVKTYDSDGCYWSKLCVASPRLAYIWKLTQFEYACSRYYYTSSVSVTHTHVVIYIICWSDTLQWGGYRILLVRNKHICSVSSAHRTHTQRNDAHSSLCTRKIMLSVWMYVHMCGGIFRNRFTRKMKCHT